jgi:hypothetical protein
MAKILQPARIRQPWLPAPFQDVAAGVARGMLVVAVAAPMLLPGVRGIARLSTGIKDTPAMSRPMRVVTGQQPIPQGQALFLRGAQPTNPFERLAPILSSIGAQPQPSGQAWLTTGIKDEPAAQPDRLIPPIIITGQQPIPSGLSWLPSSTRTDPGQRLFPLVLSVGQQPLPLSSAWLSVGVRDVAIIPSDKLSPLGITLGAQPTPQPVTILLRGAQPTDPPRLAPVQVISGAQPTPQSSAQFSPRPFDAPQQLPRPIAPIIGYQPVSHGMIVLIRGIRSDAIATLVRVHTFNMAAFDRSFDMTATDRSFDMHADDRSFR